MSEPLEEVVADLETFIPAYMDQEDIPGVSVALIRNGEVVWTEGFGVANALIKKPVTQETLFEVASNSKVVTAYIALWQWGQHIDFQSVMIIYPKYGFGVVVFTNSDLLNPDVAIEIAHRALGGKIEPIRSASHLEFNQKNGP